VCVCVCVCVCVFLCVCVCVCVCVRLKYVYNIFRFCTHILISAETHRLHVIGATGVFGRMMQSFVDYISMASLVAFNNICCYEIDQSQSFHSSKK